MSSEVKKKKRFERNSPEGQKFEGELKAGKYDKFVEERLGWHKAQESNEKYAEFDEASFASVGREIRREIMMQRSRRAKWPSLSFILISFLLVIIAFVIYDNDRLQIENDRILQIAEEETRRLRAENAEAVRSAEVNYDFLKAESEKKIERLRIEKAEAAEDCRRLQAENEREQYQLKTAATAVLFAR